MAHAPAEIRRNCNVDRATGPDNRRSPARSPHSNKNFKDDPAGCASTFADGTDAPAGCRIGSFTTVDLVGRWVPLKYLAIYGSSRNLFDRQAPLDPLTYGQTAFNPLDYAGAIGRLYSVGVKYRFF